MIKNKLTEYYNMVTQLQLPDHIVKNIKSISITADGTTTKKGRTLEYTYLAKNWLGKWVYKKGFLEIKSLNIPNYVTLYMEAITEGKIKIDILKSINSILIQNKVVVFTYTQNGITLNGRVRLERV